MSDKDRNKQDNEKLEKKLKKKKDQLKALKKENEQLQKEKEDLEQKFTEFQDKVDVLEEEKKLLGAEFLNFKTRLNREKQVVITGMILEFLGDIIPALDHLEMALEKSGDSQSVDQVIQGVEIIHKEFMKVLDNHGVKEIPALGEKFNPNIHEAVELIESELESNTIVEVIKKGYTYNDKLIRPAMVKVSK